MAKVYNQHNILRESFTEEEPAEEPATDLRDTFIVKELSLSDNIRLNLSSVEAYNKKGLTKEEVSRKILKQS